jgi:hypothetical protein
MEKYFVNKVAQQNGDHEVHKSTCSYLPLENNRQYLGVFGNCNDAVKEAKKYYHQSNGCFYCSRECHTS